MTTRNRLNLTHTETGARIRAKCATDDPGGAEACEAFEAALLASGFALTAEEPEDAPARREAARLSEARARVAELERGRG